MRHQLNSLWLRMIPFIGAALLAHAQIPVESGKPVNQEAHSVVSSPDSDKQGLDAACWAPTGPRRLSRVVEKESLAEQPAHRSAKMLWPAASEPSKSRTFSASGAKDAADLSPGLGATYTLPAVSGPTLFTGDYAYRIVVPEGATRLTVRIATTTPGVDVDLLLRHGQEPDVAGGRATADWTSDGPTGEETIVVSGSDLRPGNYFAALAVFTNNTPITGRISVAIDGGATETRELRLNTPTRFNLLAVSGPTFLTGDYAFRITVPAGATRLNLGLETKTPGVDVDLFLRRSALPVLTDGRVATDYASEGPTGDETIVVHSGSTPPLQPGTYYVAFGVFTQGIAAEATLTASVDGSAAPTGTAVGVELRSGVASSVTLPGVDSPTLFHGDFSRRIVVPQGATGLQVRLSTGTPNADVDLFVRFGTDVDLREGRVIADYSSDSPTGTEVVSITNGLRPGIYYIALASFTTGIPVEATITATVTTAAAPAPPVTAPPVADGTLRSGSPVSFSLPAVSSATLFAGSASYRVTVPAGARRLDVKLVTETPGVDVDLFVRFGQDNAVSNGRAVSDHIGDGPTGNETVVVTSSSTPALRPGVYYISLASFTTGRVVTGTVTATVQ